MEDKDMFGKSLKDIYASKETTPISVSGCNSSPYMQEMLTQEANRSKHHMDEVYNRQHGFIK